MHVNKNLAIIYREIKEPIQLCFDHNYDDAVLKLIYSAIDNFTYLCLPGTKIEVTGSDFAKWCDDYIRIDSIHRISGQEFYSARCGVLHTNTAESKLTRNGTSRLITYMRGGSTPIVFDNNLHSDLLLLSIDHFINAFFGAIDLFVVDLFRNVKQNIVDARFQKIFHSFPY